MSLAIFPCKQLRILTPHDSPEFPNRISGKSVKGFMSYVRTYKQTDKQRLQLYLYRNINAHDQMVEAGYFELKVDS